VYSFQLTKTVLGIDIGTYSLKIAQAHRAGEKVTLSNYEVLRWPKPEGVSQSWSRDEISAFIQNSLKTLGIRTSEVVSEVTGPWTVARHLTVRDLPEDEMREAIRWGAKAEFPFSLEEAIIDFHKLQVFNNQEGIPEAEVISAAATRQVVEEQTALLKQAGLRPTVLSIPPFDLMQAYRITQAPPWSGTEVLIEIGHKNTRIILLKDGNLKFSREFSVAGEAFTQALVGTYDLAGQSLEVDEPLAEKIKIKSGLLEKWQDDQAVERIPQEEIQKRLGPVMDRILLECERSVNYYKTEFKEYEIKRILLTGGGSLLTGLSAALENNLEIPVQALQAPSKLTLRKKINKDLFDKNLPFLTPVLSLITQSRPFINLSPTYLLPQEKKGSARKYLKPILAGGVALGICLGFGIPYWKLTGEIARLQKELAQKKIQMGKLGRPGEDLARLEKEEIGLNKALEGLPKIDLKRLPFEEMFAELSRQVPVNMTLTRFHFSRTSEMGLQPETKAAPSKSTPIPALGKNITLPAIGAKEETKDTKGDYNITIQGVIFGSDQEIIETLSVFTGKLNRTNYFKEAKVQMTLKNKEFNKAAAEFTVLAKLGIAPEGLEGRFQRNPV
jgi:type IV pilus assembly protein PilM